MRFDPRVADKSIFGFIWLFQSMLRRLADLDAKSRKKLGDFT